jgi:hypothetical protein
MPGAGPDPELQARAMDEIVRPTARALAAAGTPFSGVLYAGLMLTADGPKLIEYNVRFGDPECEAIMPLIDGDFAELLLAVATGRWRDRPAAARAKHAMTVIVAARGYPGTPASGGAIRAIEAAEQVEGVTVFHAGTASGDGGLVAKGGGCSRSPPSPTPSPTRARAPIARRPDRLRRRLPPPRHRLARAGLSCGADRMRSGVGDELDPEIICG